MAESKKSDLEKKINEVLSGKGELEEAIQELDATLTEVEHKYAEQRELEENKHAEELVVLRKANQQVKVRICKTKKLNECL